MLCMARILGQKLFDRDVQVQTGALGYSTGLPLFVVTAPAVLVFTLAAERDRTRAGLAVHGR